MSISARRVLAKGLLCLRIQLRSRDLHLTACRGPDVPDNSPAEASVMHLQVFHSPCCKPLHGLISHKVKDTRPEPRYTTRLPVQVRRPLERLTGQQPCHGCHLYDHISDIVIVSITRSSIKEIGQTTPTLSILALEEKTSTCPLKPLAIRGTCKAW
jgi:hypothetical protein